MALLNGAACCAGRALPPPRLRSLPRASRGAPVRAASRRAASRSPGRGAGWPGSSSRRRVRAMRLRATSTSSTLTLTMSPAFTTSRGSLTKRSDSAEMCTSPSWCTPMSTNAPNAATLLTTPSSTIPGRRSLMSSTPSANLAALNSGRGSRPGFSSSLRMSRTVGRPKRSSVYCSALSERRNALSPMICFTARPLPARMRSTTG